MGEAIGGGGEGVGRTNFTGVERAWTVARFKYIHMEEMLGNIPGARQIFERWMAFEPDHHGWMAYIKARACMPMCPSALCAEEEPLAVQEAALF